MPAGPVRLPLYQCVLLLVASMGMLVAALVVLAAL